MLNVYNIQIFESKKSLDKTFKVKTRLLVDTAITADLTSHSNIIKTVSEIFDKENIYRKNIQFMIYVNNFDCVGCRNAVRYLFTYDENSILFKVQIERDYYQDFEWVAL